MSVQRIAAIDIGTVTCRLLVARVDDDSNVTELYRGTAITNLGEGVDANGYLLDSAMRRVDAQIAEYMQVIDGFSHTGEGMGIVAMATSASRDASNADDFSAMLEARGVHLSVIPGEREAALSFLGASSCFAGERLLVTDVGGGSTELIYGIGGREPLVKQSFNVGCRRVTERFLKSDPPTPEELEASRSWFDPQFAGFFESLESRGLAIDRIVSVAGTATSMVSIEQEMERYDSSRVHGADVTRESLQRIGARLASLPLEERLKVKGLQPGRAPVIVAGALILDSLLGLAGASSFTVSERDILYGIVMDAAARA